MKQFYVLSLLIIQLLCSSAWAYDPPHNISNGTHGMSESPSVVNYNGELWLFFQGIASNKELQFRIENTNSQWSLASKVENISMTNSPSAVVYQEKIYVFHHDSNNNGTIWYTTFNGNTWSADKKLYNVGISQSPSVVVYNNKIYLFHEGGDNNKSVWYSTFDGESWSTDVKIANTGMTHSPSAVVFNNKIYLFHHDSTNEGKLWYNALNGNNWEGDKLVPNASLKGFPATVVYNNKIVIFHRASDGSNDLWSIHFDGNNFENKKCEGIKILNTPSVIHHNNRLRLFHQDVEQKGYIKQTELINNWTWHKDLHLVNFHFELGGFLYKKFKDFTLPSTHNSYTAPPLFISGNNNTAEYIPHQLDQGVRFIEVDPNYSFFPFNVGLERNVGIIHGKYYGSSAFGQRNPTDVFREIKDWLDENPTEMIILKIDSPSSVSYDDLKYFLQKSGLYNKLYTNQEDWSEMRPIDVINAGKQVVMVGTNTGNMASNLSSQMTGSVAWGGDAPENQNPTISNKSRDIYTPAMYCTTSPLGFGSTAEAKVVNEYNFAKTYIMKGWRKSARRPFAFVHDFSTFGDVMDVIFELNNCYNSIRGKVVDQNGDLINDIHFECNYSSDGDNIETTTLGTFDFPVKQGETVAVEISKDGIQFDNNSISYSNINGENLELVITSVTPSLKSAKIKEAEISFDIHPNPFYNSTTFRYELNEEGNVTFKCFDVTGRLIEQKHLGIKQSGIHQFKWAPRSLQNGIYIIVAELGGQLISRRIIKR